MNTDNNRRFQETEDKIMHACGNLMQEKPIDKVTVTDICRVACIHRTTFYGHFTDVRAVMEKMEADFLQRQMDSFIRADGQYDLYEGFREQMEIFHRNREVVKRHIAKADCSNYINIYLEYLEDKNLLEHYQRHYRCNTSWEVRYQHLYRIHGMVALIQDWILQDCPQSPAEMAALLCRIIGAGIQTI